MPKGIKAVLTDDQILQVEKLAGVLNITQISDYLGINIYVIHVNYEIINFEQSEYYFSKRYSNDNNSEYIE
jgi:hypothetical protein